MSLLDPPLAWAGMINKVPERDLQATALQLMRIVGWRTFCDRMAFRSDAGWPDITAIHTEMKRTLFVECKTEKGKLSAKQEEWLTDLSRAGNETFLLRPSYWERFVRLVTPPRLLADPFQKAMMKASMMELPKIDSPLDRLPRSARRGIVQT